MKPPGTRPDGTTWADNYQREYHSSATGASVYRPPNWVASNVYELPTARRLADNSLNVVLVLPVEQDRQKSPDALVRGPQTGDAWAAWEFKSIGAASAVERAVQDDVRSGKKQASTIALYLAQDIAPLGGVDSINRGVRAALRMDTRQQAQAIVLLDPTGKMQMLTREELDNGQQFSDF